MSLTRGIVQYLLQQPSITSIVASGNRVMPVPSPADLSNYPAVVYSMISDSPDYTLFGDSGLSHARILFDCLASTSNGGYITAHNLALAVKAALSGYSGVLPDGTSVYFAEVLSVDDGYQADAELSRTSVHIMFHYQE